METHDTDLCGTDHPRKCPILHALDMGGRHSVEHGGRQKHPFAHGVPSRQRDGGLIDGGDCAPQTAQMNDALGALLQPGALDD